MARKNDYVRSEVYGKHLKGTSKFLNNPTINRVEVLRRMYVRVLTEMAVNRFKWFGTPKSVDTRFLEMTLFSQALSVWYFDEDFGKYFALRGTGHGTPNMYDNPTEFRVYGNTMLNKTISAKECVPIWSNFTRTQDLDIVYIYADKLAELDRTIEVNALTARKTKIIVADEEGRLNATNINRKIDEGQHVVFVNKPMGDLISGLDVGYDPDGIEKLHITRTRLWNECMGLLGIDNANQDKKERLVASEVDANEEQVQMSRTVSLNARQDAAEQINAMSRFLNGQTTIYADGSSYTRPNWPELNVSVEYNGKVERSATPDIMSGDWVTPGESSDGGKTAV